jgi:putative polyketide hydroxylase
MEITTSVLIVGGSLNGLTMAMLLARCGVPCLVVERHAQTSIQYKFRGISPRSMEIYRSAGIEADIRARDVIDDRSAYVARMKNLADAEVSWQGVPWSDTTDLGPAAAATCDQDQLEPILRAHAERYGADVRFNTELVSFTQARDEVLARIRDRSTGAEDSVRAQYLIGADGTQSTVREAVGIRRHGPGVLQHWMNVIFDADLPTITDGHAIRAVFVTDINGTLVPRGGGRWLMAVQFVPDRHERAEDFTPDHCRDLIRRGAGRPDLRVDIVDARPWEAAAAVADPTAKDECSWSATVRTSCHRPVALAATPVSRMRTTWRGSSKPLSRRPPDRNSWRRMTPNGGRSPIEPLLRRSRGCRHGSKIRAAGSRHRNPSGTITPSSSATATRRAHSSMTVG